MKSYFNTEGLPDTQRINFIFDLYMRAPIAMGAYMGEDLIIDFANPVMCEIWGRTFAQVKGKPLFEALPEVSGQGFEKILSDVLTKGEPFEGKEMKATLNRKGRMETTYFDILYQPIVEEGVITGILQSAIEVTDQVLARQVLQAAVSEKSVQVKDAQAETERQKKRLELFFMQAPAAICVLDGPEFIFELVNPSYQQLFPERVLLGRPLYEALPELKGQAIEQIIRRVYETGETFEGKELLVNLVREGNLESRFFNFIYQTRFNEAGLIDGILVFAYEVNDLVIARKEAEINAKRLEALSDALPQIIWTAKPDGRHDYFNNRWFQFTGITLEQSVGNGWVRAIHPDDFPALNVKWTHSLATGDPYQVEARIRNKEGLYQWLLIRALPVKNKDVVLQWYGTCTFIQDQKEEEEKLQALSDKLSKAYEEIQASNEEIQASNEELKSLNEQLQWINADMDNFIYTASHDLKAPISNIEGLMDVLVNIVPQEVLEEPDVQVITERISGSIERFKKTIEDLTEVTKLQKDKNPDIDRISILSVIDEVLLDIHHSVETSNASIIIDVEESVSVLFSKKNLRSVIYNLLSNAIKYRSDKRPLEIFVSCKQEDGFVVLSISDNGLGIDLAGQDKLFSMFKRFHDHVDGTGIGLYMVKKIIDNANGRIEVKSAIDKGSVFTIYFKK